MLRSRKSERRQGRFAVVPLWHRGTLPPPLPWTPNSAPIVEAVTSRFSGSNHPADCRTDSDNEIRDIDGIRQKIGSELSRSFFRQGNYFDDYGRQQSCFDITKRGALVLGAQYDPMVAVAVVTAFEAMANALGERATEHVQPVYDVIETALQQWHARTEHTNLSRAWASW